MPRMDREPQSIPFWWIIVLISLCTPTESRLVYNRGPGAGGLHMSSGTHGNMQPSLAVKQQQVAVPRPVVVLCHPDSMEVVVQADMFDKGLQVDGRHLRLGSGPASESSACRAAPTGEAEYTIKAHLMDCGIRLSVRIIMLWGDESFYWLYTFLTPSHNARCFGPWFRIKSLCNHSSFQSTKEKIIYSSVLVYSPEPTHEGLLRLDGASIPVECHYEK